MKKYRCKVDTPWGKKGYFLPDGFIKSYDEIGCQNDCFHPKHYPDLFEPIEEKSDVEKLADWCSKIWHANSCSDGSTDKNGNCCWTSLAQTIIAKGFDVSKLEEECQHLYELNPTSVYTPQVCKFCGDTGPK